MERIILDRISKKFKIGFKKDQSALAKFISVFSGRETKRTILALKDVCFRAQSGDFIGIVGENASGKSTLLRVIAGIYKKNGGTIITNGKIVSLINLHNGLKDKLIMRDNIYLCCSFFNLSQKTIKERFDSIVEFAGLQDFVNTKIYQFSGGMKQRLIFSIAIHCNPDILLLDEDFEVGDEEFKNKSADRIKKMVQNGVTVLLVSHNLDTIKKYCSKVIWLHEGKILMEGDGQEVIKEYLKTFGEK